MASPHRVAGDGTRPRSPRGRPHDSPLPRIAGGSLAHSWGVAGRCGRALHTHPCFPSPSQETLQQRAGRRGSRPSTPLPLSPCDSTRAGPPPGIHSFISSLCSQPLTRVLTTFSEHLLCASCLAREDTEDPGLDLQEPPVWWEDKRGHRRAALPRESWNSRYKRSCRAQSIGLTAQGVGEAWGTRPGGWEGPCS